MVYNLNTCKTGDMLYFTMSEPFQLYFRFRIFIGEIFFVMQFNQIWFTTIENDNVDKKVSKDNCQYYQTTMKEHSIMVKQILQNTNWLNNI